MEQLERSDIQGIALYSYSNLSCAAYAMLRVVDPPKARDWLGRLADELTTADGPRSLSINLAITYSGLERLGLDPSALATFAHAFRDGMASERRARILGDDGANSSAGWDWGSPSRPVDVLLMLYAEDQGPLDDEIARRKAEWPAGGLEEVTTLVAGRQPDSKEHFGFLDGVGQPTIEGTDTVERQLARTGHATPLKPGELLLGYTDTYDKPAPSPLVDPALDPAGRLPDAPPSEDGALRRDLGRNGSYLVFRQLAQDVAAFWGFLDDCTRGRENRSDPGAQVRLGAKMVGRWPSGAPLVKAPDRDPHDGVPPERDDNDFEYDATDRHGFACPIGSHIRRANPRDALGPDPQTALESARRHRLMRRGRSYGDRLRPQLVDDGGRQVPRFVDDGAERGLHFICLNSDVERQFEFVQQTWINNPVFGSLYDETDPLIGQRGPNGSGGTLTVQADPLRTRVRGLGQFVTVRGGAYFFLPGLRALRYLATLPG